MDDWMTFTLVVSWSHSRQTDEAIYILQRPSLSRPHLIEARHLTPVGIGGVRGREPSRHRNRGREQGESDAPGEQRVNQAGRNVAPLRLRRHLPQLS